MSASNKAIVERVNDSFAKGEIEGFLSACTDDVTWTMVGHKITQGKEAIREWLTSMAFEPPKFTVDNLIAEGDLVMAQGNMTMKEKDGTTAPYAYCDIYRFRDGKIAELSSFVVKTEPKTDSASAA